MILDGQGPRFAQLHRALRDAILAGDFAPGSRLPPTREVAAELRLARSTVLLAYEQLAAEGYVAGRRGSGTYVQGRADLLGPAARARNQLGPHARTPAPLRLGRLGAALTATHRLPIESAYASGRPKLRWDFRHGMPSLEDFPLETWQRCLGRTARRASHRAHDYGSPQGSPRLREELAAHLGRTRGVRCSADDLLIVGGSQQALDLIARSLLEPGDRVLVEEPGYEGARQAMLASGAVLAPCAVDDEGLDTDRLPAARLAIVTPSHQYPLGGVMSWPRRAALLAWATRHDARIVEDDYDGEYRFDGPPLPPLKALDTESRVLYLGTFSKVMFPALRIGYVVGSPPLINVLTRVKLVADGGGPRLEQEALAEFFASGAFARHARRARTRAGERRHLLVQALRERFADRIEICGANAGLHLVIRLPGVPGALAGRLAREAAAASVGIYPLTPHHLTPPASAGFILGYGALSPREIRPGVAKLAEVLGATLRTSPAGRRAR